MFCGFGGGHDLHARTMVCSSQQARLESARMDLWTGLDDALRDDGGGGMAGVETRRLSFATSSALVIPHSIDAQRALDSALFWFAPSRLGVRGDPSIVVGDPGHSVGFSSGQRCGGMVACAIFGVGEFRGSAQRCDLEIEPVRSSGAGYQTMTVGEGKFKEVLIKRSEHG